MFTGNISLPIALLIAVSSMLVVFTVLLLLFLLTKAMAYVLRPRTRPAGQAPVPAAEDEDEILAVLAAAVRMYREEEERPNPMVRNAPRSLTASIETADPTVRGCIYTPKRLERETQ